MGTPRLAVLGLAVAVLAPSSSVSAANGAKPRVTVNWTPGACATVADQSTSPIVHFDYSIASEEDPEARTADEVGDSRTHQFFGFAKQDFHGKPPRWIAHADILRASMVDPEVVDADIDPQDILEDTSRFAASDWVRITADDARVPISFAQAAMGVDWDTTGLAPGTYEVWGYTWEPVANEWRRRPGFVKVIASSATAAAAGPSIALLADEAQIVAGSPYTLLGCADVAEGTRVTLQWGEKIGTLEPEWQTALEDEPIASGTLSVVFVPPDDAGGKTIGLRAIVTDLAGRSYTARAPTVLGVTVNPDPGGDDDGGGCAVVPRPSSGGLPASRFAMWIALIAVGLRIGRRRGKARKA